MKREYASGLRKFVVPEFVFGSGARFLAGRYTANLGGRKALLVTDTGVMQAGWTSEVAQSLQEARVESVLFKDVSPNPRDTEVMAGVQCYRKGGCNCIVAVGGGSPMDCAKGIGIAHSNDDHVLEFEGVDQVEVPGPPLICVPTTAGSSADVSQFAIISDTVRRIKTAIVSKTVVPDIALVDPDTTTTMDGALTAATGLDALAHAVEAYVSSASSPITDLHALKAVSLVMSSLLPAIAEPDNIDVRREMMLASLHAGMAFSNASLGAVHAMAHSLWSLLDLSHGEANGLLLEHVIDYNFGAAPERYSDIGGAMGLSLSNASFEDQKETLVDHVAGFRRRAGEHRSLADLGIKSEYIPQLADKAMQDLCMVTNPRRPTRSDIEAVYEKALQG